MIDNVENLFFNVAIDYYKNKIFIESYSDKYTSVRVDVHNLLDNNILYSTRSEFIKGLKIWIELFQRLPDLPGIIVNIVDDNEVIVSERFRFKSIHGRQIKPVSIHIVKELGVGDFFHVTPFIRKLYNTYQQKIIVLGFEKYREIVKNNRYVNKFISKLDDEFSVSSIDNMYENFNVYDDWFEFRYTDLKQIAAKNAQMTLREDELDYDFIPDAFKYVELPENYVCLYPYKTGIDRDLGQEKYQRLVDLLNEANIPVVALGYKDSNGYKDYHDLDIKLGVNLCGEIIQDGYSQKWHIINKSKIFITFDTSLYMLAGTTDTYIVNLGCYGDPYYHKAVRNGSRNYKYSYVQGNCKIHCITDPQYDVLELGSMKGLCKRAVQTCILNRGFDCKPEPDIIYNEVLKIYKLLI